jgi:hypothetical protein
VSDLPTNDLTCTDAEPLLPLIADGAIDAESDPALFAHLERCADCQEALARHDLINLALGQPAAAPRSRLAVRHYRVPRAWALASAAALVAAITLGAWALRPAATHGTPQVAEQTLLHVRTPGQADPQELILIHQGSATVLVDPADLDHLRGDAQQTPDANARPVRQRW